MAGGLLNLVSAGQQNVILNGNPSKTFWKTTYAKYTIIIQILSVL